MSEPTDQKAEERCPCDGKLMVEFSTTLGLFCCRTSDGGCGFTADRSHLAAIRARRDVEIAAVLREEAARISERRR